MSERKKWPSGFMKEAGKGISCPKCNCMRSSVKYTRDQPGGVRHRRRICANCGKVFSTFEK